jgi:ketosteroid isomerase-like protein
MSQENVETVRGVSAAYARGDYDTALNGLSEEIEFLAPDDITGGGKVWHGREGTRDGIATFLAIWADYHYETRELVDCGDKVLEEGWQRGRGRGSGVEVSEPFYSVWTVRSGLVTRLQMIRDRADALEAVGLSE